MFFGLHVKSNQNQAKPTTFTNSLKLTRAVLEPSKGTKESVCLMVEHENKQFILCVLEPNKSYQSELDLVFGGGSEAKFFVRGSGTVHLTGYELPDDLDDMSFNMSEDEEITSESDDEEERKKVMAAAAKGSAKKSPKGVAKTNGFKSPNKARNNVHHAQEQDDDDDDDESDDEDFDALEAVECESYDDEEDDDDDDDEDDDDEDMSDEDLEIDDSDDE